MLCADPAARADAAQCSLRPYFFRSVERRLEDEGAIVPLEAKLNLARVCFHRALSLFHLGIVFDGADDESGIQSAATRAGNSLVDAAWEFTIDRLDRCVSTSHTPMVSSTF